MVKPVTLPPGRGRLATKPLPTGSATFAKMMGMVRVCCSSAAVVGVLAERMRSGCSATSSFANRCINSASSAAQRVSIRMLRPSVHPSFCSPCRNAATSACPSGSLSAYAISTPIRRTPSGCCARAASGHAAAAPPSSVMNSRRLMSNMAASSPQLARRAVSLPPSRR